MLRAQAQGPRLHRLLPLQLWLRDCSCSVGEGEVRLLREMMWLELRRRDMLRSLMMCWVASALMLSHESPSCTCICCCCCCCCLKVRLELEKEEEVGEGGGDK